ncbi:MAG: tesB [Pseudonocardiales bacterium]|nr:tesB [Pseudonocardiales bacterium]
MTTTLAQLLDLQPAGNGRFMGPDRPTDRPRAFGGLTAAQALVAAGRGVDPAYAPHSLQLTFLRAGRPTEPTEFAVEPVREGRAFIARRVTAHQHGRTLLEAQVSFHRPEPALAHEPEPPSGPGPQDAMTVQSWLAGEKPEVQEWADAFLLYHPLDVRFINDPPPIAARLGPRTEPSRYWVRAVGELPDDLLIRAAAQTYASDLMLLTAALLRHGRSLTADVAAISLNHSMWFHRAQVGEWLRFDVESPWAGSGRALARAEVRDEDGQLVASLVQEGLLRMGGTA